jgi:adenylate cyclase
MGLRLPAFLKNKTAKAIVLAVAALSAMTFLRAVDPAPIAQMRERTFDAYQQIRPRPYNEDAPVRIVDIDEASLAAIGQWPWSRDVVASLVRRLAELGAGVIAFDVTFAEPDRSSPHRVLDALPPGGDADRAKALLSGLPDYDRTFVAAIEQAPVVLGFAAARVPNDRRPSVKAGFALAGIKPSEMTSQFVGTATNLDIFDQAAKGIGGLNLSSRDTSGIVRRVPMLFSDGTKLYPSLVSEALRVAQQAQSIVVRGTGASGEVDTGKRAVVDLRVGQFTVPLTGDGEVWLYFDRDRPERYVSAKDILDPSKDAETRPKIDGQIIFVGTSAAGLHDSWPTPLGGFVPGVSVHAHATEQILSQTFLFRPDWMTGAEILGAVLLGALLTFLLLSLGARYAAAVGVVILVAGIGGSWLAFTQFGLLFDPVYPLFGAFAAYFSVVGLLYVVADQEKKFVRRAFGQYVAPELLAKLEDAPELMKLGGETRVITLMFMDVRGFTPLSEGLTAPELVEFINRLLSPLSDTIQAEFGTIDKYIGDGIMAFWNAPLDIADHPVRACHAALKMRTVLADLNARDAFGFQQRGAADPEVRIGIGLNTGIACVGNMGSEKRFNYSAMGDVVNTTARIESNCKQVGFDIVISDETARAAKGLAMLEAGEHMLKGKALPQKLFALVGDAQTATSAEFVELSRRHTELLAAIATGRRAAAMQAIAQCRAVGGMLLATLYDRLEDRIAAGTQVVEVAS